MATKRLGRGLEALLVDVPNELLFSTESSHQQIQQERMQLLHETQKFKQLLNTFEQLVSQLDLQQNQTL
jgi:hypothetical protein